MRLSIQRQRQTLLIFLLFSLQNISTVISLPSSNQLEQLENSLNLNTLDLDDQFRNKIETVIGNISIFSTRNYITPYKISLNIFDEIFKLSLSRPADTIFSQKFHRANERTWKDLREFEKNIYVDKKMHTVLKLTVNPLDGIYEIHGVVQGYGISYMNGVLKAHRSKDPGECGVRHNHDTPEIKFKTNPLTGSAQLIETGNETRSKIKLYKKDDIKSGVLDVLLLLDSSLVKAIGNQNLKVIEYGAIILRSANLVHSTLEQPKMNLRLLNVRQLTKKEEKAIIADDIHDMLKQLTVQIQTKSSDYDPSDAVSLLIGKETGKTTGLAHKGSACNSLKGTCVQDLGGIFQGANTLAHELGHVLGSSHDFEADFCPVETYCPGDISMSKCDGHDDAMGPAQCCHPGHVMDYSNKGKIERYSFSQCSKDQIYKFSQSPEGQQCLLRQGPTDNRYPGELETVSWTVQCSVFVTQQDATYTPIPPKSDTVMSCLQETCSFRDANGKRKSYSDVIPADGTPCQGSSTDSYYCIAGECALKP